MTFVLNADVITQPEEVYISVILSPAFVKVKYENPTGLAGVIVTGDAGVCTAKITLVWPGVVPSAIVNDAFEVLEICDTV